MLKKFVCLAAAGAALFAFSGSASAGPAFYSSAATFNAAAPGLPTETFAGLAADNGVGPAGGIPIANGVNSAIYSGMIPGATYSATTNSGADVALIGPNFAGLSLDGYGLFSNYFGGMVITFSSGVTAASLDLYSLFGGGTTTVQVFGAGGLLGSSTFATPGNGPGAFFGVTDATPITELLVTNANGQSSGFTDVSFGSFAAVPEPATWAMLILGVAMIGFAARRRREGLPQAA